LGMVIFFTFIFVPIIGFYLLLWNKDSGKWTLLNFSNKSLQHRHLRWLDGF
jgi:hypothetical protein